MYQQYHKGIKEIQQKDIGAPFTLHRLLYLGRFNIDDDILIKYNIQK
jgi:hypothetical protein